MGDYNAGDSNVATRQYFDSLFLEMRHIDSVLPSTELTLFGETFGTPIMMAALSHLNKVYPEGLAEMAQGAKMCNAVNWAGMGSEEELERILATGARTVKIIKPYADNRDIFKKIEHAKRHGCMAVGMDVDHAFGANGTYDNVFGNEMRPKSLGEIREFVQAAEIPFIIKGILSEQDAEKCLEAGVAGIVVSHHHGIMEYSVPPLFMLPKIAKVINHRIPIFVDCGIASGMDVYKALALGADAVSVGRAVMEPLRKEGSKGVCNLVNQMTGELASVMARTGIPDIKHMDSTVIHRM